MEIYQSAVDYALTLPIIKSWPELQALLHKAASRKPRHWELPLKACQAIGGSADQAIPAITAIACAQISIILIDDLLDEDPRGEYHRQGPAKVANYAAAFQAASLEALSLQRTKCARSLSGVLNLNRAIFLTAFGQHLDIQNSLNEQAYWKIVEAKSAPFFGTAFYHGALSGGAPNRVARQFERLGRLYGEMIQIHDDLNDTMATPAGPDWTQKRLPLPILFAQIVDHPERARFIELFQNAEETEALSEAQDILIRSGAISYCVDQLIRRHQAAQRVLDTTAVAHPEFVRQLLDEIIAPVQNLFYSLGTPFQQTPLCREFWPVRRDDTQLPRFGNGS